MSRLYCYHGSISEMMAQSQTAREITLYDSNDDRQAPTRLNVYGDLAKYIYELEMTDAEERYLNVDYYYDRLLTLVRIEIPSSSPNIPAKVITRQELPKMGIVIFGPQEYINTPEPEPMSREQYAAWREWNNNNKG